MECRKPIDENLSDQTAIHIAIDHNILPQFSPAICGIGCLTENMSVFDDKILQPFLPKILCYIQDTTKFLNCISKTKSVPNNAVIISMDAKALYSSIPHSDGIEACKHIVIESGIPSMEISIITEIIYFILTHNYFEFIDESYILIHGTAMGKKLPHICKHIFAKLLRHLQVIALTNFPMLTLHR